MRPHRTRLRNPRTVVACAALACAGCAPLGPMFTSPHEVDDPAYLSPRYRLYHGMPVPQPTPQRVEPAPLPAPRWVPTPRPGPRAAPGSPVPRRAPQPTPRPAPSDDAGGPALGRPDEARAPRLDLAVAAPVRRQVGSGVLFEIRATNLGEAETTNVVLEATLDEGLSLPGRTDRQVVRPLGTIPAGESREVALTLVGDTAGTHCASFLVTSEGREAGWRRVCVEFVPRRLDVAVSAPERAAAGERVRFVVALANTSTEPLDGVSLLIAADAVLKPVGGSAGARQTADGLRWSLGRIAVGERLEIELECECLAPADRACLRAVATADGLPDEPVEHCIEITAAGRNRALHDRTPGDWHRRWAARVGRTRP